MKATLKSRCLGLWIVVATSVFAQSPISPRREIDYVIDKVQPAGAAKTVYDILATIKRLFPNSSLMLFHKDEKICFGSIKLNDKGEHLIIIDPGSGENFEVRVNDQLTDLRKLLIKSYGETWVAGRWVENHLVGEDHVGEVVRIANGDKFFLNVDVLTEGTRGGYSLIMSRSKDGVWKCDANLKEPDSEACHINSPPLGGSGGAPSGDDAGKGESSNNLRSPACQPPKSPFSRSPNRSSEKAEKVSEKIADPS